MLAAGRWRCFLNICSFKRGNWLHFSPGAGGSGCSPRNPASHHSAQRWAQSATCARTSFRDHPARLTRDCTKYFFGTRSSNAVSRWYSATISVSKSVFDEILIAHAAPRAKTKRCPGNRPGIVHSPPIIGVQIHRTAKGWRDSEQRQSMRQLVTAATPDLESRAIRAIMVRSPGRSSAWSRASAWGAEGR